MVGDIVDCHDLGGASGVSWGGDRGAANYPPQERSYLVPNDSRAKAEKPHLSARKQVSDYWVQSLCFGITTIQLPMITNY